MFKGENMSALKCEKEYKYTKQEVRFCDAIVFKEMTQYGAYLYAGYSSFNGDRRQAEAKASTIANKGKIKARIEELKSKVQEKKLDKAIWNFEDSVRALSEAYIQAKEFGNINGVVNAIKELNSMYGFNKQNIDLKNEIIGDFKIQVEE